jgi:competence protein ComEA
MTLSSLRTSLLSFVRASAWGPVVLRIGAVVVALVVLGWIGRTAAAGPSGTSLTSAEVDAAAEPPLTPIDAGAIATPMTTAQASAAPPPPTATTAPRGRASPTDPVYLNHASVDELRRLPGVGAKRAEAILVLRQRVGRFQRVEDLLRVKGVGRGAVKKWRPLVRLDAPSPPDAGASSS